LSRYDRSRRRGYVRGGSSDIVNGVLIVLVTLANSRSVCTSETYRSREVVAVPVPSVEQLDAVALVSCPLVSVSKRRIHREDCYRNGQESNSSGLADRGVLLEAKTVETVGDKVVHLTEGENSKVEGWKVVMQEQLTGHEVEGEVVEGPSKKGHANLVVEALKGDIGVVTVSALPT
jgi:hypothetical protein